MEKRICSHKHHYDWFPNINRLQDPNQFYKGQGYTCKNCSKMQSSLRGKQTRSEKKTGRFQPKRKARGLDLDQEIRVTRSRTKELNATIQESADFKKFNILSYICHLEVKSN